jgi:hypothetical protein
VAPQTLIPGNHLQKTADMKNFWLPTLLFSSLLFLSATCSKEQAMTDANGTVKLFLCSRGCEQYLIATEKGELLFPEDIPVELKTDGTEVVFSGTVLTTKKQVNKPGPTDAPEPDFMAPILKLDKIEKR